MVEGSAFFAYNILRGHVGATRVQEETPMIRQFTKPVEFAVAMVCDMSTLAGCYKWHRNSLDFVQTSRLWVLQIVPNYCRVWRK